jgi:hypothetical protein
MPKVRDMLATPDSARQVAVRAYEDMDEDEQLFLDGIAVDTIALFKLDPDKGVAHFRQQILDTEELLAVWALLPSYVRSAIKNARR